jgi:hypothetical protein
MGGGVSTEEKESAERLNQKLREWEAELLDIKIEEAPQPEKKRVLLQN